MTSIELFDSDLVIPLQTNENMNRGSGPGRLETAENWYAEPFTKRTACKTPGQCDGNCDCGCPYNTMTELEQLPVIEEIAEIFPDEWLAFIISPSEDEELEPTRGKLIAHSPDPDEVYDAVNTVLWNQHVYVFFNGDYAAFKSSFGSSWTETGSAPDQRTYSGPKQAANATAVSPLPDDLMELIFSALDQLYGQPNLNETIRRLRLARVRAANSQKDILLPVLDSALDRLETALPRVNEVIWFLEEALAELEINTTLEEIQ